MSDNRVTARDIREFNAYLAACTDHQVLGVYDKERLAGRDAYTELAAAEARRRDLPLDPGAPCCAGPGPWCDKECQA